MCQALRQGLEIGSQAHEGSQAHALTEFALYC